MNDSSNHQLERSKLVELGGAMRQRRNHRPPGSAPRLEARGGTLRGGAPRLGERGGWTPGQLLEGWGVVGPGLLPHSLRWRRQGSLPPLLLSFPSLRVELHMRLLTARSRPASVAQERVPAAPSPWQDSSRLSGVLSG